ncbi:MAG: hypothetical protein JXA66_02100 [Oligoflexia bacterium]|nr:hypothetical protein [Oligoflexia bacterium]
MTTLHQQDSQRKRELKRLLVRLFIFVAVTVSLMFATTMLDDTNFAGVFFKRSYAKTVTSDKKPSNLAEKDLLNNLKQRQEELDRKEALLKKEEQRLEEEKKVIEEKLSEISKIRKEVSDRHSEKIQVEKDRLDKMVITFSNMKPAVAASVFETMNINLVVKIIDQMKGKLVAQIMDKMSKERATKIATNFAMLKDRGLEQKASNN